MLKLKLQYFGHLMGRADSLEKILMLGKIGVKADLGGQPEAPSPATPLLRRYLPLLEPCP